MKDFFRKQAYKFQQFMIGRYGIDKLWSVLLIFFCVVFPFGCEGRPGGIQGVVPFGCEGRPAELGVVASLGGLYPS